MNTAISRLLPILGLIFCVGARPAAGMDFDKRELKKVKKVALISLTIDNLHTGEGAHEKFRSSNERFMNEAATYAVERYLAELKKGAFWEVVAAPEPAELDKAFADLANSKVAVDAMMQLAGKNELPGGFDPALMMQYAMTQFKRDEAGLDDIKQKVVGGALKELQMIYESAKRSYVWDKSLAFLPYAWAVKQKKAEGFTFVLMQVAEAAISDYCAKHGLDAVVVLYLRSSTVVPGKGLQAVTITTSKQTDRGVTDIKINPTLVVRTQGGGMAVDGEIPRMDDLAPSKIVRAYHHGSIDGKLGFWIDLDDPDRIAMTDYRALIESTASSLIERVSKKAKK